MRKCLLVVAVLLGVTVCFSGCLKKKEASGLAYVSKSVSVVGSVDFTKVLSIRKFREQVIEKESDEAMVELKKAGLSAEKVTSVSFGVDLSAAAEGKEPDGIIIVRMSGTVSDQEKVLELLKKQLGEDAQAQFLSDSVLAIGTPAMVSEAVKLKGGTGESVSANESLMAVSEKGSKDGLVWMAAQVPEDQMKKLGKQAPGAPVSPESIRDIFLSGDYSDSAGLSLDVSVTLDSEKTAGELVPKLEQAKGMASMFSGGTITGEMIQIKQEGAVVSLSMSVPKNVIDDLVDQTTEKAKDMPPMPSPGSGMTMPKGMPSMPNMP